jgi:fatty-acyl-CoA synthase
VSPCLCYIQFHIEAKVETPLTPMDFARRARRLYPDREAVVDGALRLNYADFFDRCDRWSSALKSLGLEKGDRIAYIAPNSHALLEAFYAVPQTGGVLVPINYRLTADDFAYIMNHSGCKIVCAAQDHLKAIDSIRDRLQTVQHLVALDNSCQGWLDYEALLANADQSFSASDIKESDLITINYTSGTTAKPKGVMITHRNAYMNTIGTLVHKPLVPGDRYLWTLPMFHANGWTFVWTVTARGATHVCLRKVEPQTFFDLVEREQITVFCAAPTVLISIANAPDELRANARRGLRLFTAGAPPAAATIERIENELGWEITQVYGLTETSPFITICEERPEHSSCSASELATIKARQGVELLTSGELRVVDSQGSDVPPDGKTMGEIVVRGNVVMKGYYNDPEATARAMPDGWFHTGDMAVIHPDGYAEIRDRSKDVIISGGENISSVEVEGILLRHPSIQEVAVVGMPHEKWGEAPHAFVVLREGAQVDESALKQFARDNMAHFKVPQWITILPELPKTATGKIQKYILRGKRSAISTQ